MRMTFSALMATAMFAVSVVAQPPLNDGDLIISTGNSPGLLARFDPNTGGGWVLTITQGQPFWVRMAPDNQDLVVAAARWLMNVSPSTGQTTLATGTIGGAAWCSSIELDCDDSWTVAAVPGTSGQNWLANYRYSSSTKLVLTTLFPFLTFNNANEYASDLVIDRDPGAKAPYVIAMCQNLTTAFKPKLLGATRTGIVTTLVQGTGSPLTGLRCIELDPATGNYLTCSWLEGVHLLRKDGSILRTLFSTNAGQPMAARFAQDGTAWIASHQPNHLFRIDMTGTVITIWRTLLCTRPESIEIYGSRRLVCNQQKSGVTVRVKSHRVGDANQPYVLACAFNRRPPAPAKCVQFASGEYLFLAYTDPLFLTTVLNLAPHVFQNFRGTTDASGAATATINVRPFVPPVNLTIFVAGVILNPTGPTVTNTHWFVL